jgi:hypothetical protein
MTNCVVNDKQSIRTLLVRTIVLHMYICRMLCVLSTTTTTQTRILLDGM